MGFQMTIRDIPAKPQASDEETHVDADTLNRVVKMALDTGEAATVGAGYELFRSYRLAVLIGPELATSPAHQAALMTIVNTGRRAMLGGVFVVGALDAPLLVTIPGCTRLAEAVGHLGGLRVSETPAGVPTLILGDAAALSEPGCISLAVTFEDWRGGVIPTTEGRRLGEADAIAPAAILAGALGVSEIFQHLRGNPMAGRRSVGLSLWSPGHPEWETAPPGPPSVVLPSRLWLIGLGHLGQAYLWTLGLLPYQTPGDVELVLQDFDRLTPANDSTSLLTNPKNIGQQKTRAMAEWAEARGFRTRLVERAFPGGIAIADDEPRLALGGVDNPQARAAYEDAGFECIVESGLGAGPSEYLALRVHAFPASTTARLKWGEAVGGGPELCLQANAYADLAAEGMDECGLVRLASRTVGAPFVGATAAALVISEVLRRLNSGPAIEVLDMTLRDPASRATVSASRAPDRFNPGFTT
jgi:hypothetical protein